jgi:predicted ATPase
MYKFFHIERFRGLQDVSLSDLSRINVLTGVNNTGKTAVLEAVFVHSGAYNPELASVINANRGITQASVDVEREQDSPWDSVFFNYLSGKPLVLTGRTDAGDWDIHLSHVTNPAEIAGLKFAVRVTYEKAEIASTKIPAKILKLEYRRPKLQTRRYFLVVDKDGKRIEPPPPAPPFPSRIYISTLRVNPLEESARFARVQLEGTEAAVLTALQIVEPRLKGLNVIVDAGQALIHGDIGIERRRYIPLAMMGDGVNRLCSVLLLIASAPHGVVLIDEIDIGWHYSILGKVWRAISLMLDVYDTQLFCTTHSRECIGAADQAFKNSKPYPMSLYRLDRSEGDVKAVRLDQEAIEVALKQNLEFR